MRLRPPPQGTVNIIRQVTHEQVRHCLQNDSIVAASVENQREPRASIHPRTRAYRHLGLRRSRDLPYCMASSVSSIVAGRVMQRASTRPNVAVLGLAVPSVLAIDRILDELLAGDTPAPDDVWVGRASACRAARPHELVSALRRLMTGLHEPALLIRGLAVDDLTIGPTPSHWLDCHPFALDSPTRREELLLTVIAQTAGEIFGYASLQGGRLVHNLMPIAGAEADQSGHGSAAALAWHTEDAFTRCRADYLALLGLRNLDAVASTLAGISALEALETSDRTTLSEPRYAVIPDDEHLRGEIPCDGPTIFNENGGSAVIPILYPTPRGPQMVIDSVYMSPVDETAASSFQLASQALDDALEGVAVLPGDVLIIDNHRAVHGRNPFPARFDGTDRWLLKASIVSSLEPSTPYRANPVSRVLR